MSETVVRFGHCDPAGIAYYPRYFGWFHDAFEDFFGAHLELSYAELLDRDGIGFPAVQVACEWHTPLRFGDRVEVEMFVSRLSQRSATFEYRLRCRGQVTATASVKVVAMDLKRHCAMQIPEKIHALFARFVEVSNDHPNTQRIR